MQQQWYASRTSSASSATDKTSFSAVIAKSLQQVASSTPPTMKAQSASSSSPGTYTGPNGVTYSVTTGVGGQIEYRDPYGALAAVVNANAANANQSFANYISSKASPAVSSPPSSSSSPPAASNAPARSNAPALRGSITGASMVNGSALGTKVTASDGSTQWLDALGYLHRIDPVSGSERFCDPRYPGLGSQPVSDYAKWINPAPPNLADFGGWAAPKIS